MPDHLHPKETPRSQAIFFFAPLTASFKSLTPSLRNLLPTFFFVLDGPYGNFAGRDASRGLAKNSFDKDMLLPLDGPIDKLEDLDEDDKESLANWAEHFEGKYQLVGKLIENKA